jgi:hypothetical protein
MIPNTHHQTVSNHSKPDAHKTRRHAGFALSGGQRTQMDAARNRQWSCALAAKHGPAQVVGRTSAVHPRLVFVTHLLTWIFDHDC